jgi:hypothetical protein
MQRFNVRKRPQEGRDFERVTKSAQAASVGRRATDKTSGAPTTAVATIAAAQSMALAM